MKTHIDLFTHLVSLGMLIFLFQIPIFDLSNWAVILLQMIQSSEYKDQMFLCTRIVSYGILFTLLGLFLIHNFVIKPNYLESTNYLVFLASTITINCWLKILFGETRPYMYALLSDKAIIEKVDCETDFGMPSGHLFVTTALYYVARVRYYETYKSESHRQSNIALEVNEGYFMRPEQIFIRVDRLIRYNTYNYLSIFYLVLLAICRYVAASHFIPQVIFGFLFGFAWSYIYFRYLATDLKLILYQLITKKGNTDVSLRKISGIFIIGSASSLGLVLCKLYLNNTVETTKLEKYLSDACGAGFHLGLRNFNDSFLGLVPLFMLYFYRLVDFRTRIPFYNAKTFIDLSFLRKVIRCILFCLPVALAIGLKYFFHYVISQIFSNVEYAIISLLAFIFICITLAFYYAAVQPLLLSKTGVLLSKEYIFADNFDINTSDEKIPDIELYIREEEVDTAGDPLTVYSELQDSDIEVKTNKDLSQ